MNLPGYDAWLQRGSGAFSTDTETTLPDECPACGTTDGILYVNDYGIPYLTCATEGCETEQDVPEPDCEYNDDSDYWRENG